MSDHGHIYGEIHNKTGMKRVFGEIWRDVDGASGTNLTFGALWRGGKLAKTLGSRRYLLLDFIERIAHPFTLGFSLFFFAGLPQSP